MNLILGFAISLNCFFGDELVKLFSMNAYLLFIHNNLYYHLRSTAFLLFLFMLCLICHTETRLKRMLLAKLISYQLLCVIAVASYLPFDHHCFHSDLSNRV